MNKHGFNLLSTVCGVRFIAVGDWGMTQPEALDVPHQRQTEVATAMNQWASQSGGLDYIVSTGDNFYPRGVESAKSIRFNVTWRNIYNFGMLRNVPWYIAIGNHDYEPGGEEIEQHLLTYGHLDNIWILPHFWYTRTFRTGRTNLQLIILDTTAMKMGKHNSKLQYNWMKKQLMHSKADWQILVLHHPVYSVGNYGPCDRFLVQYVLPFIETYGVDIVLSGHDHTLQHIKSKYGGPDFVISGAGGKEPYEQHVQYTKQLKQKGIDLHMFVSDNGFVAFDVFNNRMKVQFYDRKFNLGA